MLRSILVSRDEKTAHLIERVFKDLEVEFDHCTEANVALAKLSKSRYDAIVVDDHMEEAVGILAQVTQLPTCDKAVRIVLAEPLAVLHTVFKTGTQVILYKPLSMERVRHGLRAVHNLMARDRRRGAMRVATTLKGRLSSRRSRNSGTKILIVDLSDSGAAIHCAGGDFPSSGRLDLEFTFPGDSEAIHATVDLVWQKDDGAAGVRFLDVASHSRKRLTQWLKEKSFEKQVRTMSQRAGR